MHSQTSVLRYTIIINLLLVFVLIRTIEFCHTNHIGIFRYVKLPYLVQVVLGVLILDLVAAYLSHRVMHKYSIFWKFHQVHHLDEMVDVTTGLRQHPLETLFRFFFLLVWCNYPWRASFNRCYLSNIVGNKCTH